VLGVDTGKDLHVVILRDEGNDTGAKRHPQLGSPMIVQGNRTERMESMLILAGAEPRVIGVGPG
jgi:hypothetical protein